MKSCETCRHWRIGDPSDRYQNVGVCTWACPQPQAVAAANLAKLVPRSKHVPFWLGDAMKRVASHEGRDCPVWVKAPPPLLHANRA